MRSAAGPANVPVHPAPISAETLPAAVRRWRQLGVPLLLELLAGVRAAIEGAAGAGTSTTGGGGRGGRTMAQQLFAQAQAFLQVANILNEEYPEVRTMFTCRNVCMSWEPWGSIRNAHVLGMHAAIGRMRPCAAGAMPQTLLLLKPNCRRKGRSCAARCWTP